MTDYTMMTDSSGLQLIMILNPDIEQDAPVLQSTVIGLAKKHNVHAVIEFFELEKAEHPPNTCLPNRLYFALTELEALYIEERLAHVGHTRRLYSHV